MLGELGLGDGAAVGEVPAAVAGDGFFDAAFGGARKEGGRGGVVPVVGAAAGEGGVKGGVLVGGGVEGTSLFGNLMVWSLERIPGF